MASTDSDKLTHTQTCITQIQHDILRGVFKPGEKLQTDKLKQRYAVGSSPIREALFYLVTTGLITSENNKGFSVTKLTELDVFDLYQTFKQIECLVLEHAITDGDAQWEGQIMAALHCLALVENKKGRIDYQEWSQRNNDFHQALIAGCKSTNLLKIRNDLWQRLDWCTHLAFIDNKAPLKLNHQEHKKLAEVVIKRDKKLALQFMQEHIGDPSKLIIPLLKKRELI